MRCFCCNMSHRRILAENHLYIVMEMVEGASLQDHFNALIEKQQSMDEPRIWKIFVQICMALRYIHKEKVGSLVCCAILCWTLLAVGGGGEGGGGKMTHSPVVSQRSLLLQQHVVHRDLTPANIMLGWNDRVKISTFPALLKTRERTDKTLTWSRLSSGLWPGAEEGHGAESHAKLRGHSPVLVSRSDPGSRAQSFSGLGSGGVC